MTASGAGGLTATELALVVAELGPRIAGTTVRDVARPRGVDDLLLFLDPPSPDAPRVRLALHIAPGGPRARVTLTARRFARSGLQSGPLLESLRQQLLGATLGTPEQVPGERRLSLPLRRPDGSAATLHVELFGARGLWCLADGSDTVLEMSRLPTGGGRTLRRGAVYRPPEGRPPASDPPVRFAAPVLEHIDAWFTATDQQGEVEQLRGTLEQGLERAARKLEHKLEGFARQRTELERIPELRRHADLLLAYGFRAPAKATELRVPDPDDPEREVTLPLQPGIPIQVQAERVYQRARKLQDGAEVAAARNASAAAELQELQQLLAEVRASPALERLQLLHEQLCQRGIIRRQNSAESLPPPRKPQHGKRDKLVAGLQVRMFTSAEGYPILVGRTNQQNDRLSLSVARGNDLWLHVGRGHAGSHVVVRLPKGKTASLQTMLDAGTLAIHFSKARNAGRCEVIYTQAKNVRKPKGLPPGMVTTTHTKTLQVDVEPDRLRRLLDSAPDSG
ncbi:MAG: DUF814 domain-containing protein [Planctomycetes bacterium]|nr:DUF814 domain-containing protein [Planctomycetota bacterium]